MKPIPTIYRGIEFRSKLEAKWAVFFDLCGIEWEYEPQGFELDNGQWYLPDFLLHDVPLGYVDEDDEKQELSDRKVVKNFWIEVKGVMDEKSRKKIYAFKEELDDDSRMLVVGNIPFEEDFTAAMEEQMNSESSFYCLGKFPTGFLSFPGVDKTGTMGVYGTYKWFSRVGYDSDKTIEAYRYASNYHFDHKDRYKKVDQLIPDNQEFGWSDWEDWEDEEEELIRW